ncbi:MAG: alpha/beta fold hydrolase [Pirellulales bacterium]|nr:alpha/beta fold hydrolase [Pirellulales bacterium]
MRNDDWRSLYPFQSHWLSIDGHRMHYLDEGEGPVLLLVHGNPTWSFYWRELVLALRGKYRLIVPDHIGCGMSDKPPVSKYSYQLARRIGDLGRLIEQLDLERITLVAHDWGGAIGMGAAVAQPHRFSRFALMNTAAFRADHCPWRIRLCHVPGVGAVGVQGLNLFVKAALRMAAEHRRRMTPAVRAGLSAPYNSWANRVAVLQFAMDIPLKPSHPTYATLVDIENGLTQFADHPVLLVWGMKDWCFTPAFLNRFLDFFPKAEVERLDDAGHYVVEDAHERVIPLLDDFLRRTHEPARAV